MGCQDYEILIQKAIDGALDREGYRTLASHINVCPECAAEYKEYKALDAMLKQEMAKVEAPADLKDNIMAALPVKTAAENKKSRRSLRPRAIISVAGVAVAAAALVLTVGTTELFAPETVVDDNAGIIAENPGITDFRDHEIGTVLAENDPAVAEQIGETEANDDAADKNDAANKNEGAKDKDNKNPAKTEGNKGSESPKTITYSGGVMLPHVAHSTSSSGSYSEYTLAAHEDYDCILPRVSGNIVTYYIVADGCNLEWETYLDRSKEPAFQGETESLPFESNIAGYSDRSGEYGYNYVTATSSDQVSKAVNKGGDAPGFYIIDQISGVETLVDAAGGGSLVSWAPDGNKVLYTRRDGSLHVYYPDQKLTLDVHGSHTYYVCWAGNSRNIVFSAWNSVVGQMSIYSVIVP